MERANEWFEETADYIKARIPDIPETAIILGSGLGKLVDELENLGKYCGIVGFLGVGRAEIIKHLTLE